MGGYLDKAERERGENVEIYLLIVPTYLQNWILQIFFLFHYQSAQNPLEPSHLSSDPFELASHTSSLSTSSQDDEDEIQLFQVIISPASYSVIL